MLKILKLINSEKFALIDDEHYEILSKVDWKLDIQGYPTAVSIFCGDHRLVDYKLHRVITNAPCKMAVDHINHDKLDNRNSNLRVCTIGENSMNRPRKNKTRIFKNSEGFYYFRFSSQANGKFLNVTKGPFKTEEIAMKKWNDLAVEYRGEYANLS